jgi:hypothetical protein
MEIKYVIQISYLQLCALMKWDCSKLWPNLNDPVY